MVPREFLYPMLLSRSARTSLITSSNIIAPTESRPRTTPLEPIRKTQSCAPASRRRIGTPFLRPDPLFCLGAACRRCLTGLAYRMLGSMAEAEDAVQEAYLRWHKTERASIDSARAFLSKTLYRSEAVLEAAAA